MVNTKAFFEKYKGYPIFSVWEVDEQGNKVRMIVSMGTKKAAAIMNHMEDFKTFAVDAANRESNEA